VGALVNMDGIRLAFYDDAFLGDRRERRAICYLPISRLRRDVRNEWAERTMIPPKATAILFYVEATFAQKQLEPKMRFTIWLKEAGARQPGMVA
jgi:hypothetical protein